MPQLSRIVFWIGIACLIIGFGFHAWFWYDKDLKRGYDRREVRKVIILGCGVISVGIIFLIISFVL